MSSTLKDTAVKIKWTASQTKEFIKCARDPIYFIRKYIKIVNVDKGLIPFDLFAFEEDIVNTLHHNRFVIGKLPRQSGKTITVTSYLLHYVLFNENVTVAILANKGERAREILSRLQKAYEFLPSWLQQGIITWNKGSIELENGSKIIAAATTTNAIRGGSCNIIFLDEFAHIGNTLADEFFTSVYPTISSGLTTKVFIFSTPKGMNMFYKLWTDAENKRSSYIPLDIHWTQVPFPDGRMRDEKWKQETIANTSEEDFEQEFGCEFIGSSDTLISGVKLRQMAFKPPLYVQNELRVYENPKADRKYVMAIDTAQGKRLDYSVIVVIDVSVVPYRVVAMYRSNRIKPILFPNVVHDIGRRYNDAHAIVEVNDGSGIQCVDTLHYDLEYENIFTCVSKGRQGQKLSAGFSKNFQLGVKTTTPVKRIGCANLKSLIETDKLIIEDFDIISELATFIQVNKGYEADEGYNDDLVMALVIFSWLCSQKLFKELITADIRSELAEEYAEQLEHSMTPFGFLPQDQTPEDEESFAASGDVWTPVRQLRDTF